MSEYISYPDLSTIEKTSQHEDSPYSSSSLDACRKNRRIRHLLSDRPIKDPFPADKEEDATLSVGQAGDGGY